MDWTGSKVDQFEKIFRDFRFQKQIHRTGSGTDSLHLAYLLAGIKSGDEVITPVFTCTDKSSYSIWGGTPIFTDVDPNTLNIDVNDIEHRITEKQKL